LSRWASDPTPKADRVECGERDVADPELERHDEVHQPDDEGHRDEEDHQRAVGREDLVVMLGRQVAKLIPAMHTPNGAKP
jgi:hypothetical protein